MQDTQPPPCFIFDLFTGKWCPFNTLIIDLDKENNEFFRYRNFPTKSDIVIRKTISYDYIAYYIKSVPSHLKRQHPSLNPLSTYLEYQSVQSEIPTAHKSVEIGSIIMLEDLPLRYGSVVQEDQYILLGFDLDCYKYDEANHQVKYIRDLIADLHMKLKYSEEGLVYQVTKRLKTILYKTMKYSLVYIADLMNIPQELPVEKKLQQLHKISFELAFQDFKTSILKDSKFYKEVVSIAYKTIMMVGLFPAYVELNTMDEAGILLKVKNWLTNSTNAPYGASHHASFSLGNFRYSFIFDLMNKDKQKVNITEELRRGFSLKNQAYEYFRVKFFDFFPMDSWVTDIANRAIKLLPVYFLKSLEQVPDGCELYNPMKNLLVGIVEDKEQQEGRKAVTSRIAREFYHRYGEELDHSKNGKIFKKITKVISDAELRGYKNLRNNCQTIVLEIIGLLSEHLNRFIEPLMDLSQLPHLKGDDQHHVDSFLKFGSQFNKIFTDIGPFPLNHKLSYFDTFSDKDSCVLLYPKHFENLRKRREQFFDQENVREFLRKLEEALAMAPRIHVKGSMPDLDQEKEEITSVDFKGGEKYGVVSCLIHLIYNELFDIRREIKIARECQENFVIWQENGSSLSDKKTKKKEIEEWQMMIDRLPMLYKEKYSLLDVYKELCFYYYNTVRLGIQIKVNDSISCLGFLLIRKPDVKIGKDHEEDGENRRNSREIIGLELTKRLT